MSAPLISLGRMVHRAQLHDPRNRWFGAGRSLLAAAHITVLAFTAPAALLAPILGDEQAPHCHGVTAVSAYCVGGEAISQQWRRWLMVAILVVVASGYRPRWTAVPHAWVAFSIGNSIALPDGGESVAKIVTVLIIPICLADNRTWQWQAPRSPIAASLRTMSFVAFWAVRVQIAGLYLDSAISKLGVADWVNGSAEYYFVRGHMFGVAPPFDDLWLRLTEIPIVVFSMTWGAIIIEILIALCLMATSKWRRVGFVMDILLHGMIIVTMGLWSFATIMIASSCVAAMPDRRTPLADSPSDSDANADAAASVDVEAKPFATVPAGLREA
ncbi:sporulation-delaying protein SdpB family protein [Actinoplanes sp. NPDC020271]|uniref:sporulation-delaying protein SdpB family protein n=1 Tax=Actinoplanes sp. NPDC020271 TaxID=3363896 RepID=UPI0037AF8375